MPEITDVLTHGQARTLIVDGDPESDKEEQPVEGQFAEAEEERSGNCPAPDDEDTAASGETKLPTRRTSRRRSAKKRLPKYAQAV